jgi:hypothetical protein
MKPTANQKKAALVVGGGLVVIGSGFLLSQHKKDKAYKAATGDAPGGKVTLAPKGHPVPGLPTSGDGSPVGITPPGVIQPSGSLISLPPMQNVSNALHDAAAALVQSLTTFGVQKGVFVQEVKTFQDAYNVESGVKTKLAADGKYGPKGQAALQSVITPAVAPSSESGTPVVQPLNPAPAADPVAVNDIGAATAALVSAFAKGARKGSIPQVVTFQQAWNAHPQMTAVVPDGKYGGNTEVAVQSVLNWMAQSGVSPSPIAPKNAYGKVSKPIPVFTP